ncbi:MAG: hypothetical protein FJW95_00915 [Actinobacteria bacterium]|nr:hypothetical protein [Actinomycetota bacterium]
MTDRAYAFVLDPRAEARPHEPESATFDVGGPIAGKVVGLRLDAVWRSYVAIVDEWERLLVADGAVPKVVWVGERVGAEGERTRSDLEEWSRLIDVGVVGLGN